MKRNLNILNNNNYYHNNRSKSYLCVPKKFTLTKRSDAFKLYLIDNMYKLPVNITPSLVFKTPLLLNADSAKTLKYLEGFINLDSFIDLSTSQKTLANIIASKGSIEMYTFYNDVKMYQSNAFSDRINLQPGLASNKKLFREYITRYQTSFNKLMIYLIDNKIVLPTNHPIYGLNKKIQREVNNILPQISKMRADKRYHNFFKFKDKKVAFVLLGRFNAILIEGLLHSKVRSLTNISINNDVEMDNEFSFFYYQNLERNFSSIDYLNKFDYKILFSSNFYRLDHRKQLKILLEIFPPEVKLRILESLKYVDHAN